MPQRVAIYTLQHQVVVQDLMEMDMNDLVGFNLVRLSGECAGEIKVHAHTKYCLLPYYAELEMRKRAKLQLPGTEVALVTTGGIRINKDEVFQRWPACVPFPAVLPASKYERHPGKESRILKTMMPKSISMRWKEDALYVTWQHEEVVLSLGMQKRWRASFGKCEDSSC